MHPALLGVSLRECGTAASTTPDTASQRQAFPASLIQKCEILAFDLDLFVIQSDGRLAAENPEIDTERHIAIEVDAFALEKSLVNQSASLHPFGEDTKATQESTGRVDVETDFLSRIRYVQTLRGTDRRRSTPDFDTQ